MTSIFSILALAAAFLPCYGPDKCALGNQTEDEDLLYATELLKPGTPAPDFTLNDLTGQPVRLSDFKGKKVVLVFWATWCPDCRAEVPQLKAMMASPKARDVVFLNVSFDRKFEALEQYVKDNELGGVQLFDPAGKKESAVSEAFHVKWIPSLYLIGADGKVQLGTVMIGKIAKALGI